MNTDEFLQIHRVLWNDTEAGAIHTSIGDAIIVRRNSSTAQLQQVTLRDSQSGDDILIITQNLKKRSTNTDWVEQTGGMLTWVIRNDVYVGRIQEWDADGQHHIEVFSRVRKRDTDAAGEPEALHLGPDMDMVFESHTPIGQVTVPADITDVPEVSQAAPPAKKSRGKQVPAE